MKRLSLLLLLPLLASCGSVQKVLPDKTLEYKKQREAAENLELPPDLVGASFDDAMDVPPLSGSTTFSEYAGQRSAGRRAANTGGEVLPEISGVELERSGDQRWLQVDATPDQVWPQLIAFWRQQGILLVEQDPATGTMKTDWLENRAEIRDDFLTRQLRRVMDGMYATSTRDQYRVRIDNGPTRGTTEIFLTHRGMEEKLVGGVTGDADRTVWEPAPADPGKEAAMLRRLMLYLGVADQRAQSLLASTGGTTTTASAIGATLSPDGRELVIPEEFRSAWRQTGLALDRSGFAVRDRDRSQGVFYVRYDDPNRQQGEKKGLLGRIGLGGKSKDKAVPEYQVRLVGNGGETRVSVRSESGATDDSATAKRILSLLQEQLR